MNGEAQQDSNTAEMVFSVSELLEWLTATVTLLTGDLLFTGTPHGTGGFQQPPRYLTDGDVVEAGIGGIGSLTNVVRAKNTASRLINAARERPGPQIATKARRRPRNAPASPAPLLCEGAGCT